MNFNMPDRIPFHHYLPKYKCCCGSVHVKQGTLIIAILYSIMIAFVFLSKLLGSSEPLMNELLQIVVLFMELLSLAAVFKALTSENEKYLLPFMVFQMLGLMISGVVLVISAVAVIDTRSFAGDMIRNQAAASSDTVKEELDAITAGENEDLMVRITAAFAMVTISFAIVITVWWMLVLIRCYVYFKDLNYERAKRCIQPSFKAADIHP